MIMNKELPICRNIYTEFNESVGCHTTIFKEKETWYIAREIFRMHGKKVFILEVQKYYFDLKCQTMLKKIVSRSKRLCYKLQNQRWLWQLGAWLCLSMHICINKYTHTHYVPITYARVIFHPSKKERSFAHFLYNLHQFLHTIFTVPSL